MDIVGKIMDYEGGEMNDADTVKFFGELVRSGQAWRLQGHYGRTASALIEGGYLDRQGKILRLPEDE